MFVLFGDALLIISNPRQNQEKKRKIAIPQMSHIRKGASGPRKSVEAA
jgi:hypothetical protein